jgi:UDP-N-acetylglucosamine acyltransferase
VGLAPQHTHFDGTNTRVSIGDEVVIREMASVHRSINPDPGHETRVGNRCYLMGGSHVGHDCVLGEDVMLAQGAMLGGHSVLGARAFLGGNVSIHQFVRVGRLVIIAGGEALSHDIPPFAAVRYWGLKGYNAIGCKRAGMPAATIHALRSAYRCILTSRTLPKAIAAIRASVPMLPEIQELLEFLQSTKRGILPSVRATGIARAGLASYGERDAAED